MEVNADALTLVDADTGAIERLPWARIEVVSIQHTPPCPSTPGADYSPATATTARRDS